MDSEQIFDVGGIQLRVGHHIFGDDGGPAVSVFAEIDGKAVQVMRFDRFRKEPHYHYDPTGRDDKRDLGRDTVSDPIAWTLEQLRHHLLEMIRTAVYRRVAENVDPAAVAPVLSDVESIMRAPPRV